MPSIDRKSFYSEKGFYFAFLADFFSHIVPFKKFFFQKPTPKHRWKKGLLFGANHIGDILYRSASFPSLPVLFPDCKWHILAPSPASQVLENNPFIHKVHQMEIPRKGSAEFSILIDEEFDVAMCYDTNNLFKGFKLMLDLGIPNRVGISNKGLSGWINHPVTLKMPQPFPAYFKDMLEQVGGKKISSDLCPEVYPNPKNQAAANALFSKLGLKAEHPIVGCFVTSRQKRGVWPSVNICNCILELERVMPNIQCVVFGSAAEAGMLFDLKKNFSLRAKISAGDLDLLALCSFLRLVDLVVTTDSGPRHLANAVGTRSFFYRNVSFNPIEAGTYLKTEFDLAPNNFQTLSASETQSFFDKTKSDLLITKILEALEKN